MGIIINSLNKFLKNEEKYTRKIIDTYVNLNQKVYEEDQAKEFHKLSKLTDEFLDYIKKDEQISESEQEDEMEDIMSVLTMNRKIRENTFSQNLLPGVQKDNPDLQKL